MNVYCVCELLSVWTAPCKDLGYDEPEHATCDRDRGLWQGCELPVLLQTGKTCCIDQYWSILITGNSVQLYRQNPTTMLIEKLSILITDTGEYFCVSFYMNQISRKWGKGDNIYNIYSIFKIFYANKPLCQLIKADIWFFLRRLNQSILQLNNKQKTCANTTTAPPPQ